MHEKTKQPIQYGMFIMPFHPPAKPLAQCYDEDLELIVKRSADILNAPITACCARGT